jgi:2-polyprenyl-6-methoxyphenol hydroxylase-like FAD-dependent oxidoreductase
MEPPVKCCIVGGGPAGMMAGLLLARAGVETLVLEKHKDFLRDFRGDTVHPSTLEVIHELGLLDDFLKRPHQKVREIRGRIGGTEVTVADFSHTPTHCHFIAFMPQWEFLNFLAEHARRYPTFQLKMEADVTALIEENGRVAGVRANTPQGLLTVKTGLVIGADGRQSAIRTASHLEVEDLGSPIDVLWMRLTRKPADPAQTLGYFNFGRALVLLNRDDYWQCAFVIRKGEFDEIRAKGMPRFRQDVARITPFLADRVDEIQEWSQINLLTVRVDRLRQWWRAGLLCIGDSAHAMSPVGGVGINLAIQDAVAAANILSGPLKAGTLSIEHLRAVQRRRTFPTRVTQRIQILIQERVLKRVLGEDKPVAAPWPLRLFNTFPVLRRIPARAIGVGVRPEHVRTKSAD